MAQGQGRFAASGRTPLRAVARSRRSPAQKTIQPLWKPRLIFDEIIGWRAHQPRSAQGRMLRAVKAAWDPLRAMSEADFAQTIRSTRIKPQHLTDPRHGAMALAIGLEVIRREIGLSLRENQIACALSLLAGECVELRTGEGKTLAAALAGLVAARAGVPTHVVTVNDYLARRDHALVEPLARRMGVSCAVLLQDLRDDEKRRVYDVDLLYGTNKTFVFDHLRDKREQMKDASSVRRQMGQAFAIVDEADSVLIDDATVPMILSEPTGSLPPMDLELFQALLDFVRTDLQADDRTRDQGGGWRLTVSGMVALERRAASWRHPLARGADLVPLAEQALAAVLGFRAGEAYVIKDGEIAMIDQSTGRLMPDRRWAYGLHQMVELAAGVSPTPENRTVAQITQQTYFRQYRALSGLTGTARECRAELYAIYRLGVRPIAPHAPSRLADAGFRVFGKVADKWDYIAARAMAVAQDRAVLIGLNDVSESAALAARFADAGRDIAVLDALSEAQEADLVAQAGQRGRITIATHLAGRGTDIGLDADVRAAGGLHVILGSVMASGRLERQLYGRAGRQGDPGSYERVIALGDRGLVDGARSVGRVLWTLALRARLWPAGALARIQANRDRRAGVLRRKTLLREQELAKQLGYR